MPLPGTNQVLSASTINTELERSTSNTFNTNDVFFRDVLTDTTPNQPISFSQLRNNTFKIFRITSNTANFNLVSELQNAGYNPAGKVTAFINITNSAIVHSNSHNLAAIHTGAGYKVNDVVKIMVDHGSAVIGGGGIGGEQGSGQPSYAGSGTAGGPAIVTKANTTVINHGLIVGGGGGGGGGAGAYTTPNPPSPPPCFAGDTQILLRDGTKKNAADIKVGDVLHTLTGKGGKVLNLYKVKQESHRRMMRFQGQNKVLRITDDHDLWIRNKDGVEKFGVFNYNGWLYEEMAQASHQSGEAIDNVEVLLPKTEYEFAVNYGNGWLKAQGVWEENQNPDEDVYCIEMDEGMAFIGDDFVICNYDWYEHENKNISWKVIKNG